MKRKWRFRLTYKMLAGYLVIVLLPFLGLFVYLYHSLALGMLETEGQRRQTHIAQAAAALESELLRVEAMSSQIQQNSWVSEYIHYPYGSDWEPVYNYFKNIRPQLQYYMIVTSSVESVHIYADIPGLYLGGVFLPLEEMPLTVEQAEHLRFGQGLWSPTQDRLCYITALTDADYSGIGILESVVSPQILEQFLEQLQPTAGTTAALVHPEGQLFLPGTAGEPLLAPPLPEAGGYRLTGDAVENWVYIKRLDLWAVMTCSRHSLMEGITRTMVGTFGAMLGLLLLLSWVYLLLAQSVTRRVRRLARHIRRSEKEHFTPYLGKAGGDEIGELIATFNQMASRTELLVNTVQKEEILRRDAQYDALQAKIQPHFLYGTLESIRMMAEERGVRDVADIILSFSKLMRYSLHGAAQGQTVPLADEVENARLYLQLQKLRYEGRLLYSIDIPQSLMGLECPRFLLQPLLENSICHGVDKRRGTVHIRVTGACGQEADILEVSDDGVEIPPGRLSQIQAMLTSGDNTGITTGESGFALYNINTRLCLFFGPGSGLEVENRKGGVTCRIVMRRQRKGGDECGFW